ncbi:MAG: MerR family transcriptional regulator [Bryobacterales bacterium]|nr:MerR family transcriptional regulator [Bryobacteraceae bacterium]MDW8355660.1 MerR family transcriptional regulator [Bryobacterales bacterium]
MYKLGTVSRLTGFSPSTLRAWERRYGLLRPARSHGGQRLYSEEDVRLLLRVRELMDQGHRIGEIVLRDPKELLEGSHPACSEVAALGDLEEIRRALVEAALAFDADRLEQIFDETFARLSPQLVLERVVGPVAERIGELWASGRCTVASEHLFTEVASRRLRSLQGAIRPDPPQVLAACFPDERHELGLLMATYEIMRRGIGVLYLGAAVPFADLEHAYLVRHPVAVLLSVTLPSLWAEHRDDLAALLKRHGRQAVWAIGGRGSPVEDPELSEAGAILWPAGKSPAELADKLRQALRGRLV